MRWPVALNLEESNDADGGRLATRYRQYVELLEGVYEAFLLERE